MEKVDGSMEAYSVKLPGAELLVASCSPAVDAACCVLDPVFRSEEAIIRADHSRGAGSSKVRY